MTALIETGRGEAVGEKQVEAEEGCIKLEENPAVLDTLRKKNIRAIVARFESGRPCSGAWLPLGKSPQFFFLPL
jgi:hypothetical protein